MRLSFLLALMGLMGFLTAGTCETQNLSDASADFVFEPENPTTADVITFSASTQNYEDAYHSAGFSWAFDTETTEAQGAEAEFDIVPLKPDPDFDPALNPAINPTTTIKTNEVVTHQYQQAGTYRVTLRAQRYLNGEILAGSDIRIEKEIVVVAAEQQNENPQEEAGPTGETRTVSVAFNPSSTATPEANPAQLTSDPPGIDCEQYCIAGDGVNPAVCQSLPDSVCQFDFPMGTEVSIFLAPPKINGAELFEAYRTYFTGCPGQVESNQTCRFTLTQDENVEGAFQGF